MSWTLLLFAEAPPTAARPERQLHGMGSPAEVRERISAGLGNGLAWYKDGWGQYGDDSCMLEFHVPEDENPVVCVMIHVRGMGAVESLLRLAQQNGWCLVDDSLTPMSGS
jgi:hypothetical protein